jgi:hypothetical protein
MDRHLRCAHGLLLGALFAAIGLGGFAGSLTASAASLLVLDNIVLSNPADGTEVTIPHVEFADSNLERADAERLFSMKISPAEERDLVGRLKAASIVIPDIRVKSPGGSAQLHDLRAENVDSGRIGKLSLAGADIAAVNNKGDVKIVSQALRIDAIDFSPLLHGLKAAATDQGMVRFARFELAGMNASIVDTDTPADAPGGNIVRVGMGALTAANEYDGPLFRSGSSQLKNLTLEAPPASSLGQLLKQIGYDRLDFDLASRGAYDPKAQSLTLEEASIVGAGMGRLALRGRIGSLAAMFFSGDTADKLESWLGADVSDVVLRFDNGGLFDKLVNFAAERSQRKPAEVKAEWRGFVTQALPQFLAGSSDAQRMAEALSKFIGDPKTFTLTASGRAGPIAVRELRTLHGPEDFFGRVSVHASANE